VPLYEYRCTKCKHRFEKIQKFSDRLVKKCPECGGPVERPLSAPAVHFKGSGFYVNDYAAKKAGEGDSKSAHDKEEKKHEANEKAVKEKSDAKEKGEDKPKKSTAKKPAEKD
jgi:putative FmdB family regulatory protein